MPPPLMQSGLPLKWGDCRYSHSVRGCSLWGVKDGKHKSRSKRSVNGPPWPLTFPRLPSLRLRYAPLSTPRGRLVKRFCAPLSKIVRKLTPCEYRQSLHGRRMVPEHSRGAAGPEWDKRLKLKNKTRVGV